MGKYYIHPTSIISDDSKVGSGTKIWQFCHIFGKSIIGSNSILGQNVMVGPNVTIGSNCKIQNNVSLYKGITIENNVFCGPSCVFTNVKTPRAFIDRSKEFSQTVVREGSSIGANATIVCGVEIGKYSMIAAGAVVTRDVKPFSLVMGLPAKHIGWISKAGERLGKDLICTRTGKKYEEKDNNLYEI
jgi:UDP-2-acetamido-3-amino-2,3-dideoxy-glucuronate N-acetyltransferase